ncbi:ribonuclease activity regulator RraA [Poritiphilus flavus]|uniref:Ribonuclease activity regulator RraA n=1 Tax=Poritiphilus flavus TaxID=2697053 RepID=A0A6L9E9W5_9FLAO|nr:ribonuclease activity regulator RraA [Poritiphilus flavus]NAS11443.1 ribonuclease activity regulator RraA [Poritiphilus flavus]
MEHKITIEKLRQASTATVATCLFKRGLKNQFIQEVRPLKPGKPTMVGQAYTLRYIPAREDLNPIEVFKDPKHLQRIAIEECPEAHVLVIDSRKDARAASAGSILATRLMKRGVTGMVTDGSFRDSAEIAELDFPAFHQRPSAPTNLTLHQAIAINEPIGCGDVAVFPGDFVIGDDDGVIVVPSEIADEVAEECLQMTLFEEFVSEKVQGGTSIIGLYPLTNEKLMMEFEQWRKRKLK